LAGACGDCVQSCAVRCGRHTDRRSNQSATSLDLLGARAWRRPQHDLRGRVTHTADRNLRDRCSAPRPGTLLQLLHQLEDQDAATGSYTAFDGAATLLSRLHNQPWALVNSNYAHRVRIRLARTHLPEPPLIIDAEAVSHGKPDPQGYLLAARALNVDPKGCLVIEDSPSGVAAARAAGATVWAVNTATPMPGADRTYPTLKDAVSDVLEFANSIGR